MEKYWGALQGVDQTQNRRCWAKRIKEDLRLIGVYNIEDLSMRQGDVEGHCCCGDGL